MNAAARLLLVVLLVTAAYASCRPVMADAHTGDHGKTVFFENVYVKPDEVVDGDLNVVFGDAQIAGTVRGDVNTLFGHCTKIEGAQIDGEEHCLNSDATRALVPWIVRSKALGSLADQDRHLMLKLGSSAIVLLLFLLFPVRMRMALDRVERQPGLAAVTGAAAAIAVVPIGLVLLFSIIGIPLIALEGAAIVAGIWLGTGAVALLIGRRLAELVWPTLTPSPLWALVLGLVVVSAAETVPVVGWAVTALVWLVGLGASILACTGSAPLAGLRRSPIGGPPMASV